MTFLGRRVVGASYSPVMSAIWTASLASRPITSNPPLHADIVEGWHRTAKGATRWCLPCDEVLARSLLLLAKWSVMARLTGSAMAPRTILGQAEASTTRTVPRRQASHANPKAALATELP